MRNRYGSWIDSGFVLKGNTQYEPWLPQTERQVYLQKCLRDRVDTRVSKLTKDRNNEMDTNILWAMNPTYFLGYQGVGLNVADYLTEDTKRNKNVAGVAALIGIASPGSAAAGVLFQGGKEGVTGSPNYYNNLAKAKERTADDEEICNGRADKQGI
jgi:hypothetical protein